MRRAINRSPARRLAHPRGESLEPRQLLAADGVELAPDSYVVRQNAQERSLLVLSNDHFDDDYAGERLITSVSLGSAGGRIGLADDQRSVIYAPPADFAGTESFTYYVDDQVSAQVTLRITSPLTDDHYDVLPDRTQYTFRPLQNDPFWAGYQGSQRITLVSQTTAGEAEISADGKSIVFTRPQHQYGRVSLVYIVDQRFPANLVVDIANPLQADQYEIVEFTRNFNLDVLRNDPFWEAYDGARRITHLLDAPESVQAEIVDNGKSLKIVSAEQAGWYNLRYVVDGQFEANVSLTVHHPVRNDYATVDKDSSDFYISLLENDWYNSIFGSARRVDVVDRITSVGASQQGGVVRIDADGQGVHYSPPTGFVGTDEFSYTADDRHVAQVTVAVIDPGTPNPIRDDSLTVFAGTIDNVLYVLQNDFFGDGYQGPRKITRVDAASGGHVRISSTGRELIYTPQPDTQYDAFSYEVDGAVSARVNIYVRSPVSGDNYTFAAPQSRVLQVLGNDVFSANYPGPGVITDVTQGNLGGDVRIAPNGRSLEYVPGNGAESFTYTVDDRFTAYVNVNYPSRLAGDPLVVWQNSDATEVDVLANDFQFSWVQEHWGIYNGPRRVTDVTAPSHGTAVVSRDGKSVSYRPAADYVGRDSFVYIVDGFLRAEVTVDVARLLRHDRFHVDPGSVDNVLEVLLNDLVGGDYTGPLTITNVSGGAAGSAAAVAADGKAVVYTPPRGFTGRDALTYTVDGRLKAEVVIDVNADVASLYPKFGTLEEFREFWNNRAPSIDDGLSWVDLDGAPEAVQGGARDHSETNVQVEGVDEADLIETDSDYLYAISHGDLVITRAWPADQLEVVSRYSIKGSPIGQYLYGDRLTIISQESRFPDPRPWFEGDLLPPDSFVPMQIDSLRGSIWPPFYPTDTIVTVLDVSNRARPKLVQRTEIDSTYVQSRRIDDYVYLVLEDHLTVRPGPWPLEDAADADADDFAAEIESRLPRYESYGPQGNLSRSGMLVQPEDIFKPLDDDANQLLSVAAINVTNSAPGLASTTGIFAAAGTELYVSLDSLYVFQTKYGDWANNAESQDRPLTGILKFNLNAKTGGVDFAAAGNVPGMMLNQFSADAYDGYLRVATNVNNWGAGNYSGTAENSLFVLRDDQGVLEFTGAIQNLALNESIRSVRFFDERAFVVTYRSIDPLFALDLSDPAAPRVTGHLALPGFASYMQFVSADRLLTIGPNGVGGGGPVSISLFNVANLSRPVLVDQFNWGRYSSSVAADDHHAFGWFAAHDTLALPSVHTRTTRVDADQDGYAETPQSIRDDQLYVFEINVAPSSRSDQGIQLRGRIDADSALLRSAYIADKLYAVAEDSIVAAEINAPDVVLGRVDIRPDEPPPDEPGATPPSDRVQRAAAVHDLSQRLGVAAGAIMHVASEMAGGATRLVLRSGNSQYAYRVTGGGRIVLESDDFVFANGSEPITWRNEANPLDVNGDGVVTPQDGLLVIQELVHRGSYELPSETVVRQIPPPAVDAVMVDASGDGMLSAQDALLVIRHLSRSARQVANLSRQQLAQAAAALDDD